MTGAIVTRDGRNQRDQGRQEPVGPGKAGTSGTREGRSQRDQGRQEPVGQGWLKPVGTEMVETSETRARDGWN
jgi:hypothetical protein